MLLRRLLPLLVLLGGAFALLTGAGVLLLPSAGALPAGGTDTFNVSADVTVASRLGQETIAFTGTATILRDEPRMEGGVEVADLEVIALDLRGNSVTGPVVVTESTSRVSPGELRSLQPPPDQFPASSFLDAFIEASIPVSGGQSSPTVHNEVPLHLVPTSGGSEVPLDAWPPVGATFAATPQAPAGSHCAPPGPGGLPLLPALPAEICVLNAVITIGELKEPTPTGTPCPPEVCTPTPTMGPTPTGPRPTGTPPLPPLPENPTLSVAAGGPSGLHPADLLGLVVTGPPETQVSGNDNFVNAWEIASLPFAGVQNTTAMTTETGEPLNPGGSCIVVAPAVMGHTVWYRLTPSASGTVDADTMGSDFDTVLAAYGGTGLNQLSVLDCDDDGGPGLLSRVTFPVSGGSSYYLQAGGFDVASGTLRLNVSLVAAASGAGQAPAPRITCAALGLISDGCGSGSDGTIDDIDGLSYGADFMTTHASAVVAFSVAPGSAGQPGSAVAQQAACSPPQPQADEFISAARGGNTLVFDGDGRNGACPTADSFGLAEVPLSDDLDALDEQPPSFVDGDGDGMLDEAVFFTLAPGSPSLIAFSRTSADILWTLGVQPGFQLQPGVYASASALGLRAGDAIDALCIQDEGSGASYDPAVDRLYFSLAAGSPTLAANGLSAADLLVPGPAVAFSAEDLGLLPGDDLNALKCFAHEAPVPTPAPLVGDVNCSGRVDAIDAALVLQFNAGLLSSLTCAEGADVNRDGTVNSIDAALILQLSAGLISRLPP